MTATGAFLVFAAAAVFVAVQWDHIPDGIKLAALGLICGGCLLVGRARRRSLPATSAVLYHLGAFLVPVVSAALVIHHGAGWSTMVLIEGTVASAAFWWLNRTEQSVVLDWATTAAVVVAAVGIGATTAVPAPVALIGFAAAAELAGRHRRSVAWALVAGLAPLVAVSATALALGPGVLDRLGLTTVEPRLAAVGVGALSAFVIGRDAARRHNLLLVVLATVVASTGLVDGWTSLVHTPLAHLIGAAALFAVVEAVAFATTNDPFWGRPTRILAGLAELAAGAGLALGSLAVLHVRAQDWDDLSTSSTRAAILVAGGLGLVAWFVADLRRRQADRTPMGIALLVGAGWTPATVAMVATVMAAVGGGIANPMALGIAAIVVAALLVVSGRPGADVLALILTVPAPFAALHHPGMSAALALSGGVVLASVAVIHAPLARSEADEQAVWLLAVSTTLPTIAAWFAARPVGALPAAITAVLIMWTCGIVLEGAEVGDRLKGISLVPRVAALLTLIAIPDLTHAGVAALTALLAALALLDTIAWRRPLMALQAALLAPVAVGAGLLALPTTPAVAALSLMGLAALATAVDPILPEGARMANRLVAASAVATALVIGGGDQPTLATMFIVVGALALAWAARFELVEIAMVGGLVLTGGIWLHLLGHQVRVSEPYLAPVVLALLVGGALARRRSPLSSWVAYGPALALMGGAALAERFAGGGAGHAFVAGGVGVVAVIVGGQRRLIAPLLIGTVVLVALTIHETLAVTAGVPTWGWLGLGGTALIAAGVTMERAERGPLDTGRRIVDVIDERFT